MVLSLDPPYGTALLVLLVLLGGLAASGAFLAWRRDRNAGGGRDGKLLLGALECLPAALVLKDREGRLVLANPKAEALLGRDPGATPERSRRELFPPERLVLARREEAQVLEGGPGVRRLEEVVLPDGARREILYETFRVEGGGPGLPGVGILATDLSDLAGPRGARASGALGDLASGTAHEFNNLLGAMLGRVELARMELRPRGEALEHFRHLDELVARASGLVAKLLAGCGRDGLRMDPKEPAGRLGPYRGSGTILVVDDEDVVRAVAVGALRRTGFDTLEARNGREALEVFAAHREAVVLVLMDLAMPVMDGDEALAQLRATGATVPVLLTTGLGSQATLARLQGLDLSEVLLKPYRYQTLVSAIRGALEGRAAESPGPGRAPARG